MHDQWNRRNFLQTLALGSAGVSVGQASLCSLLAEEGPSPSKTHFPAKAKRVIYLFMHGGPSQLDLFDHKPELARRHGEELPESVRANQRLTGMTSGQASLPITSSLFQFQRHGQSGAWISEVLPHTAAITDELCFIRSVHTEAINHDPAVTLMQTGHQQAGRPSFGAWASYGLGTENKDLPAFVVMVSQGSAAR
ncbi:DUF1501 domain-containing protein, partial [Planctomycetaceae bacterium]|nr:DUF1501 domain-containing protein [Planctomycetaceae bacterium]